MPKGTRSERFWQKVDMHGPMLSPYLGPCWVWMGARTTAGYGSFGLQPKGRATAYAHRLAYEWMRGPIPGGLHLDHLCRNRACCNPAHLEPVTNAENIRRGNTAAMGWRRDQTHCKRGHVFDEANTYVDKRGRRCCRACGREKMRRRRATKDANP